MGLRPWPVWLLLPLLLASAAFLLGGCAGSSSHSLCYFYTRVSESGQGLPQFTAQGSIDDHIFIQYDSDSKRALPQVPWVQKVGQDYPHYWDNMTQIFRDAEEVFRVVLESVQRDHEQSTGLHTWQVRYGCELSQEGRQGAHEQEAYDGRVYLDLDMESLSWMAVERGAQVSRTGNQTVSVMAYEGKEDCVAWLRRYLDYGKEALLRTEPPVVKVTSKEDSKGPASLVCRAYGFYPKDINAYWRKDGEVWVQDTFRRVVAPNSDGTYHAVLGIKTNPEERKRFQCHVEHGALAEHLDVAWQEPAFSSGLLILCIVGAVVLVAGISVGIKMWQRHQAASKATYVTIHLVLPFFPLLFFLYFFSFPLFNFLWFLLLLFLFVCFLSFAVVVIPLYLYLRKVFKFVVKLLNLNKVDIYLFFLKGS